ncbi:predicted protein [Botrytis cinerea T4]|uniref:Uncharacterized protein n=1 Tax=Botryotinia fuckeliana (strain T4) TaxID=999810 RepID=G2XWF5_BOTF4|nr:predicted protein [Botrytis cinerea T4]
MSKRMYNTTILKELLQSTCRPSHDRLWKRLPKNMGSTIMDHSRSALSGKLYDENLMVGLVISTLFSQR